MMYDEVSVGDRTKGKIGIGGWEMPYDELVKRLWECASGECFNCSQYTETTNASVCSKELMKQAADAIEELSRENESLAKSVNEASEILRKRWIKFVLRPLTEEEQREHPDWCYILDCHTPDDGQEILVSDGRLVWTDTFYQDGDQCYLDSDTELESCWWKPMPQPPKEES